MTPASLEWLASIDGLLQSSDLPPPLQPDAEHAREASVLVGLFSATEHRSTAPRGTDHWRVLYIRRVRSERDRHSGQVAFPGGKRDPQDATAIDVALREAHEEVGLDIARVQVLGTLEPYLTISNYRVTPVVAVIPYPDDLIPEEAEVARIFSIPLSFLCERDNLDLRDRNLTSGDRRDRQHPATQIPDDSRLKVVYFKKYDNELLWGATARMTLQFLKALHDETIVLPATG